MYNHIIARIVDIHEKGIKTQTIVCVHKYKNSNISMYTQTQSQFLFEVNRTSIHGEILEKLCASHHASTHIYRCVVLPYHSLRR